jgi:ABC-type uncharacterized transport system ATPase component
VQFLNKGKPSISLLLVVRADNGVGNSALITVFSTELSDQTSKLDILQAKLDELERKKKESEVAIDLAKSRCDQFTRYH